MGMKTATIRAKNVPGSAVGSKRYHLYVNAFRQIEKARKQGFHIECIAILESIMADRLEARRVSLNPDEPEKHRFSTLGGLTSKLKREDKNAEMQVVYSDIASWAEKRNRAIHEIVKLGAEQSTNTWEERYSNLADTVTELYALLSAFMRQSILHTKCVSAIGEVI